MRILAPLLLLAAMPALAAAPALTAIDKTAIFAAAGFKPKGNQHVRCADDPSSSYMPGSIEAADLNNDGLPEAFVRESSSFCYGAAAEAVVLVTRGKDGKWRKLLDETGMYLVEKTRTNGWSDITIGGPGMGAQPVFRFNGTAYVRK